MRLPNGNTLIACADGPGGSRVFEVDPGGKTVWQVQGNELPGVSLKFMAGLQRLPNGNTVMANWLGHNQIGTAPDLIEVTPGQTGRRGPFPATKPYRPSPAWNCWICPPPGGATRAALMVMRPSWSSRER